MQNGAPLSNGRPHDQEYVRGFWNLLNRHRALAFGVPLAVVLATVAFVFLATPIYESDGSLRVDEEASTVPVLDALKSLSTGSKLDTEMGVLRSRSMASEVVDSLGLALTVRSPRRVRRSELFSTVQVARTAPERKYTVDCSAGRCRVADDVSGNSVAEAAIGAPLRLPGVTLLTAPGAERHGTIHLRTLRFEKAVKQLREKVVVERPDREADIIAVHYESADPELAAAVPNTLMRLFLRGRQQQKSSQSLSTAQFLRWQIDTLNTQLTAAEDALKRFREQNQVVSPEAEAKADVTRLVELQAQRDGVESEQRALSGVLTELQRATPPDPSAPSPMRRLIAFPTLLKNPATAELLRSLNEVENQRSDLLIRRTPEDPDVQTLTERVHQLEQQLSGIAATYLSGLTRQVGAMDDVLGRFSSTLERIPATEIAYARLERQAKVLSDIYTLLQTRLKESEIMAAVVDPSVRVVDAAPVPYKPVRPDIPLSLAMSVLVGLILGFGLAYARDHLDTSVRTREDLQIASGDVPVLATIPRMALLADSEASRWLIWRRAASSTTAAHRDRLVAARDPRSPVSEAYRSLRTNITFSRPEQTPRMLVFTSPEPGDGKSTSTVNLAVIQARQGMKCLLIDADLRRGVLHEVVDASGKFGLSNVLVGASKLDDVIQHIVVEPGVEFQFLAAGTLPPNPAELLGSPRMDALLLEVRGRYDMVVIDAPPLNLVTDAAVLGPKTDGVIIVARAGVTDRGALQYAMEQLRAVRAPVLGSVLNGIDPRRGRYYGVYGAGANPTSGA